jgi:hypothetical protein
VTRLNLADVLAPRQAKPQDWQLNLRSDRARIRLVSKRMQKG